MPAEVETMMYAGDVPWHGLGCRVPENVTSDEAIVCAGLDWEVECRPLYTKLCCKMPTFSEVADAQAVVRKDTETALGVVGSRYKPIQNREAFNFFDDVVGEKLAIYHTAGSLSYGRKVWILAQLPEDLVIGRDDVINQFLLLSTSHDGSGTLRMLFTPVRVVCQNTLNIALQGGKGEGIAIRHTENATRRAEDAVRSLKLARKYYKAFGDEARKMLKTRFSLEQMHMLSEVLFEAKDDGNVPTRTQNNRDKLLNLYEGGTGIVSDIRGTEWAAFNAVTEYADHVRSTRTSDGITENEARLHANWFGSGALLKQNGYDAIKTISARS